MRISANNIDKNNLPMYESSLFISDINDALMLQLKAGNAKNIARYFATNVTLSILSEDGQYSKFQAEMLLESFFSKNKPGAVKLIQKITNKTNYSYYVYQLTSNKNLFRVFVKISSAKSTQTIEEFRVEKQASK
ncbi:MULTISPECIES: DUF4783 domain-containing protein [Sphingobacterium]|uniref:DUF4783 domain-containing protein n=1 Tax=Sphingobacterium kitahiroshimense TaxID=470446 RepID=A0ABV0BVD5_9SPHI|nr:MULTISPECIES: DUF4783 domain-containing protein [Sphingobacterium]MCS3552981.1 hypothetical protein [Sphingobacterium sp. JUb21]MCW2258938.1 hypothetical protein [Sphingobacterium kitahiroshimense]